MNAEVDALVAQWRDEWELVRLKDVPAWTTHRAHLDKFVEQLDELREALAARPAAPTVGEAERLREAQTQFIYRVLQEVAELPNRTSPDDWPEAMLVTHEELTSILRAALTSPAPQPADGVTQAQHEIVASIIDMVEHDQSRRAEMNRLRADALRAVLARALASPAPQPAAPAPVWHGCKAGGAVCARYKPTGIGCAEGECDLASGVWAAPAPVEPPMTAERFRALTINEPAPVEPPPASQEALPCKNCRGFDLDCNRCGGSGYVIVARRKAQE